MFARDTFDVVSSFFYSLDLLVLFYQEKRSDLYSYQHLSPVVSNAAFLTLRHSLLQTPYSEITDVRLVP